MCKRRDGALWKQIAGNSWAGATEIGHSHSWVSCGPHRAGSGRNSQIPRGSRRWLCSQSVGSMRRVCIMSAGFSAAARALGLDRRGVGAQARGGEGRGECAQPRGRDLGGEPASPSRFGTQKGHAVGFGCACRVRAAAAAGQETESLASWAVTVLSEIKGRPLHF